MVQRTYFVVHGSVQGVFFRRFTYNKAIEHNVTGWCRNTAQKTVEGEAQADKDTLGVFFDALGQGPPAAEVTRVEKHDRDVVDGEEGFEIRKA